MHTVVVEAVPSGTRLRLHRQSEIDVRRLAGDQAVEAPLCHTDDRHRQAVHADRLIEDGRARTEPACPIAVGKHDHGMTAGHHIIRRAEQPANDGAHSEHVEEVAGHRFGARLLRLIIGNDGHRRLGAPDDAREHLVTVAQIPVNRIRKNGLAVVAREGALLHPGFVEHHDLLGIADRQQPEQHLVE